MPTSTNTATRTVIVCLPASAGADWFTASDMVDHHLAKPGLPVHRFPVRRRRLLSLFTRFSANHQLLAQRSFGAVTVAAGGRLGRLDLTRVVTYASAAATARWRYWQHNIARITPAARPWVDFLAQHQANPAKVTLDDARRRFENQPRVLAMLALSVHPVAPHIFDPYEVEAYQAGEAAYVCLYWRTAIAGEAMITAEGQLLQPESQSLPDRLRYLAHAASYIHRLRPAQYICAMAIS
jgi:hypothetical protein